MTDQSPFQVCDSAGRISPARFMELLLSRLHLERVDRRHLGLRGVKDLNTGELFEIEERKLFAFQQSPGSTA